MTIQVTELKCDYLVNPLGIDNLAPVLGWTLKSSARGVAQSAYQYRVALDGDDIADAASILFDSGKVASDQSQHIEYSGPALETAKRYCWQARVWDQHGQASEWSDTAWWEMGLLGASDWRASWIEPAASVGNHCLVRKSFPLRGKVRRARLYATAHGLYQIELNGRRVGDGELAPGWTSYAKRLQYQTYDVTALLKEENAIGALLSEGWYCGVLLWNDDGKHYGARTGLLAQLAVEYDDGSVEHITTDGEWTTSAGPIVAAGIYMGETYDARLEPAGWSEAGFDDSKWAPALVVPDPDAPLVAQAGPPVKNTEELTPVAVLRGPSGETILDMGQNMVGWTRLRVSGPAGATVTLRHAEVLTQDGALYTENLRKAAQTIAYTLKGEGVETYEPHFTFMGFRYVEVTGWPGELREGDLVGVVVHSDIPKAGDFEASNPLLNKLQHAIWWGQRGNFVDVPTDCPQRDERMGWTGDAQVFAPTAAFNADVSAFFRKWLKDLTSDQRPDGNVAFVVPDVWQIVKPTRFSDAPQEIQSRPPFEAAGGAGWGDAAVIVPWSMYLAYGDPRFLREQYESMKGWVGYQRERAGDDFIWSGDFHFGDWLDFGSSTSHRFGMTDHDLLATAFFARSTDLLSRAAGVLGETEDQKRYEAQFRAIRKAFQEKYVRPDATIGEGTQTPYVLALEFNLLEQPWQRKAAAAHLVEDVRARGHLTTGFLGTPWLLFVLSDNGYLDDAYMLLNRMEFPSWLYPISKGATTIWERWDGLRPDGAFQDVRMNSFNHYAYGAVGDWMYKTIAGINIDPQAPGYKRVVIAPQPGGGLTSASARHRSVYGEVVSSWRKDGDRLSLSVVVPPNASGSVRIPSAKTETVEESGKALALGNGVQKVSEAEDGVVVEVGSGRYEFTAVSAE
jgi:alpha-L-rhamnosidase